MIFQSCKKENIEYSKLIECHTSNEKVNLFLNDLGSNYEFNDSYGRKSYIYKNKGIELNISKADTLNSIFFKIAELSPEIKLPYNINSTDNRKNIEEKIGKPDKYFQFNNLIGYYLDKQLVVRYNSKDSTNMNNGIKLLSIEKLDKNKILGIK